MAVSAHWESRTVAVSSHCGRVTLIASVMSVAVEINLLTHRRSSAKEISRTKRSRISFS